MDRCSAIGRALTALVVVFACVAPAGATDYYVRLGGNDTSSGTSPASAWRTIDRAMDAVVAGDTVYVGAGTYDEQVRVTASGTPDNPIRLVADTGGSWTGDAGEVVVTDDNDVIEASGPSHVHVEGFTLRARGSSAIRIGDGTGWVIRNCVLEGGINYGFYFRNNGSARLEGVTIRDASGGGLFSDNGTIYAEDLTIEGVGERGINLQNSNSAFYGHRVRVLGAGGTGVRAINGDFLLIDSLIANCGGDAVHVQNGSAAGTLVNSTVYGCDGGVYMVGGTFTARGVIWADNAGYAMDARNGSVCHDYNGLMHGNGGETTGNAARTDPISGEPGFIDAGGGDFRVGGGSAAIDAGHDASSVYGPYGWSATDLDGAERGAGSGYDAGAYEGAGLIAATIPYEQDFIDTDPAEWSDRSRMFGRSGVGVFMGNYGNVDGVDESVSLALQTTPGVKYLLTFDLIVMEPWDGAGQWQDDFRVAANNETIFDESFDTNPSHAMSYPYPPDISGSNFASGPDADAVYRDVEAEFTADTTRTTLVFTGVMSGAKDLENWGLDNVRVDVVPIVPADVPYAHDFEAEPGREWNTDGTDASEAALGGVLGPVGGETPRTLYLNTTPGETYWVYFDLLALDGWSGQAFTVTIDDTEIESVNITAGDARVVLGEMVPESVGDVGYGAAGDTVFRMARVSFVASGVETRVTFAAELGEDEDEDGPRWALDNVLATDSDRLPGLNALWVHLPNSPYVSQVDTIDFSAPDHTSVELDINWPDTRTVPMYPGGPLEQLGVWLSGYLEVPESGDWQFRLSSDDGSKLRLAGGVVVNHDGQHGPSSRTGTLALEAGFVPIDVRQFEWRGRSELILEWRGPSDSGWEVIPATAYSRPAPLFVDISIASAFDRNFGGQGGLQAVDFDSDGDLDVLATGSSAALLINDGEGGYASATGLGSLDGPVVPIDLDGDGDWDLATTTGSGLGFYENIGGGTFFGRGSLGTETPTSVRAIAVVDANRDGHDDVVSFATASNTLYINGGEDAGGHLPVGFEADESEDSRGLDAIGSLGSGTHASAVDANSDGFTDLFYPFGGGRLFLTDNAWSWAEAEGDMPVSTPSGEAFGAAWADFDNDGDMDVYVPNPVDGARGVLFRNEAGVFVDVSVTLGVITSGPTRSAAWGDFDNDGDLDLAIASSDGTAVTIYEQIGGTFAWYMLGVPVSGARTDVQWGDIDNDGDLDLMLRGEDIASVLLRNRTDDDRYLRVRLVSSNGGSRSRSIAAARVELWDAAGQRVATRELAAPRGNAGWGDEWAHFGGIDPQAAYEVRVRLPGDDESTAFAVTPGAASSLVGGTILPQTLTIDAWQIRSGVRVTRWRETGVTE